MSGTERAGAARARLIESATERLYLRNPFRVSGLPSTCTGPQVRRLRQRIDNAVSIGSALPSGDPSLPLPSPPTEDALRQALRQLDDPVARLVAELLWWWGPAAECGCPQELHDRHDSAVLAHALALDAEATPARAAERDTLWARAAQAWGLVAAEELRPHLSRRVVGLGDRRVDESVVDGLLTGLPFALLRPLARLAAAGGPQLLLLDHWGFLGAAARGQAVDEAVRGAVAELGRRADRFSADLRSLGPEEATPRHTGDLLDAARPLLQMHAADVSRDAARTLNRAAIVLNNCANELSTGDERCRGMLQGALHMSTEPETRETIRGNVERLPALQLDVVKTRRNEVPR